MWGRKKTCRPSQFDTGRECRMKKMGLKNRPWRQGIGWKNSRMDKELECREKERERRKIKEEIGNAWPKVEMKNRE